MSKCKRHCPGGSPCDCNGGVDHELHICRQADCYCHSEERYLEAKALREMKAYADAQRAATEAVLVQPEPDPEPDPEPTPKRERGKRDPTKEQQRPGFAEHGAAGGRRAGWEVRGA